MMSFKENASSQVFYSILIAVVVVAGLWIAVKMPMTADALSWYHNLETSPYEPAPYVFSIVWTALWALLALSMAHLMMNTSWQEIIVPAATFIINSSLQIGWSYIFFGQQNISAGYFLMLASTLYMPIMTWSFYKANKLSGLLLIPQCIWMFFALYLSWFVWMNN